MPRVYAGVKDNVVQHYGITNDSVKGCVDRPAEGDAKRANEGPSEGLIESCEYGRIA